MKKLLKITLVPAMIFAATQAFAQEHHESAGHSVGHAAKVVGHKTSEVAAKGAAAVTDKRYKNKWGPHGEDIYIDVHNRYFYVDKLGHRSFLKSWQLRNKPYHK